MYQNPKREPWEEGRTEQQKKKTILLPDPNGMFIGWPMQGYEQPVPDWED